MIETNEPYQRLIEQVFPGSSVLDAQTLNGGSSAVMTALTTQDTDAIIRKLVVRQPGKETLERNPNAAQDEFRVLRILHTVGLPVPIPYALVETPALFSTPCLVIEYIEGQIDFSPGDRIDFARQFASALANIHNTDYTKFNLSFLPRGRDVVEQEWERKRAIVDASLDEGKIRAALQSVMPILERNEPTLLQGDYWASNTLWKDGKLAAVIDWEDAAVGDPLMDFAVSRLDVLWIFGESAFNAFNSAYRSRMKIDFAALPYWDLYAALRLIRLAGEDLSGWTAFFAPYGREDITEQSMRGHLRSFVQQAFVAAGAEE